jgi:hypothetical protein
MAHFHTFIPSESRFDYSNIDNDEFGWDIISQMQEIEDYDDRKVEKEFKKKMEEQWEEKRFTVNRNNFWETYRLVRDFLEKNENKFTVQQKRAILMYLYERDAILRKIEIGDWSYVHSGTQSLVGSNITNILKRRSISRRRVSEEKAKAKKTKAATKEAAENKIIKSMKKRDLTGERDLTGDQQNEIKAIEKLAAVIEKEADVGQNVPNLGKSWWKVSNLDNFLKRKKNELEEMRISNEKYRNGEEEGGQGEGQEKGFCTVM